jgi:hypothetical protein
MLAHDVLSQSSDPVAATLTRSSTDRPVRDELLLSSDDVSGVDPELASHL